jgi:signal transduction histidine kinase
MAQGLQLVDQTADAVRRIATDLRPALLDDLGLAAAVEWYARDFAHRSGLDVECFIEDENFNPPDRYAIALYRVLQEALTNIARHARAKRVQVSLMHRAGIAQLHVRDDGCGYEIEPQRKDKTLGLISMRERVAAVGGELRIDSATGKGTTIFVRLPIDSGDSHAD